MAADEAASQEQLPRRQVGEDLQLQLDREVVQSPRWRLLDEWRHLEVVRRRMYFSNESTSFSVRGMEKVGRVKQAASALMQVSH